MRIRHRGELRTEPGQHAFDHAGAIRLSLISIGIAFAITLLAETVLRRRDA